MYLFKPWFSLDICPGVGLLDHIVALFLVYKGASILDVPIYISTNSVGGFPFLHTLSKTTEEEFKHQSLPALKF